MNRSEIRTWTPVTGLLVLVMLAGAAAGAYRLQSGLGAATNLSDAFPWGLWIGVDMLAGVAMAAGGFIIASMVYLFNMKRYQPIVRPAILTAFIGYLLAVVALFFDLGQPFRIWHPAVMWQVHSVMWVVAIHVILYTTTLALEFSPMFFERVNLPGASRAVRKIIVPVVLFGALLSVLHQSSLGGVFLITAGKMSPLWYNQQIPTLFLVSAIMMGLSMVSFETAVSSRVFKHPVDPAIFRGLARGSLWVVGIYLVLKLYFLLAGPGVGAALAGTTEANMYLLEMVVGVVVPFVLLLTPGGREREGSIMLVNVLVVLGVLLNRLNVSIFGLYGFQSSGGASYFPSFTEFVLTAGLICLAIFLFKMAAKHLPLLDGGAEVEN